MFTVCYMIGRHYSEVLELDRMRCLEFETTIPPMQVENLENLLTKKAMNGVVVEEDGKVVGFMFYTMEKDHYRITNMAVCPESRLRGIGRLLIENMIEKLKPKGRNTIHIIVPDLYEGFHCFLRSMGFKAVKVYKDNYPDGNNFMDDYHFRFLLGQPYVHEKKEVTCIS